MTNKAIVRIYLEEYRKYLYLRVDTNLYKKFSDFWKQIDFDINITNDSLLKKRIYSLTSVNEIPEPWDGIELLSSGFQDKYLDLGTRFRVVIHDPFRSSLEDADRGVEIWLTKPIGEK